MSILKDKFITNRTEKENINKKIKETHVQPTEQEQNTAQDIIRKVSEQYAEELISKDISDISNQIAATVREYCNQLDLTYEEQKRIEKTVLSTVLGHGPIEPLLQDNDVSEIVVQKYDNIVYEKDGIIHKSEVSFVDENHLRTIINRIVQKAGRQINIMTPIVDARLEDGSRVNATIPPVSPDGATLTIRKFNNKALSGNDYLALGSLNRPMLYFLNACVRGRISIFVSGGTGTGKTTLLNMLSAYVPSNELIITIAKCMRKAVGHNGQCYRIGGDEFVIILKNKTAAETEEIINKVRCEIEFADKQSDITISVAIGYVWTDTEQKNLEDLMQHADDEMYKDKKKTKENKSKENTHSI